jgi:D-beta-D-heptose 7-phosphate kinase/D-beta-D-heptose 1-phosphate adenosyltransferase
MSGRLVVVGDAMLDRDIEGTVERICPEAPVPVLDEDGRSASPGGAARAAVLAAQAGCEVTLVAAVGDDRAGARLRSLLERSGVEQAVIPMDGPTPEKIRLRAEGRTLLRLDRGGPRRPRIGQLDERHREAVARAHAVLVSDYGRGMTSHPELRRLVAGRAAAVPVVWDPHPRGREPVPAVALVTPNRREAADIVAEVRGAGLRADATRARQLLIRWHAHAIAVTLGAEGALLDQGYSVPTVVPAPRHADGDPCGAGDSFAAAAAAALMTDANAGAAVTAAVAASTRYVAGEPEETVYPQRPTTVDRLGDAIALSRRVRAEGGTVVATGGCFDLLHAGHISTLEAARRLGDCLIVLLNSDDSVSRLKGSDRPVVSQDDRACVLESLACVDAVVVFGDSTPGPMLERLKPQVFAKGGDYAGGELPETAVMRRFNGQTVILPTLAGRSTSELIARATRGVS